MATKLENLLTTSLFFVSIEQSANDADNFCGPHSSRDPTTTEDDLSEGPSFHQEEISTQAPQQPLPAGNPPNEATGQTKIIPSNAAADNG